MPHVSVVIPACNEARNLHYVLHSLAIDNVMLTGRRPVDKTIQICRRHATSLADVSVTLSAGSVNNLRNREFLSEKTFSTCLASKLICEGSLNSDERFY